MTLSITLRAKVNDRFGIDVSFDVPSHGVTALLGPSGSGKTSILRAIAGLERYSGDVLYNDEVWQSDHFFMPTYKRGIGYVFQGAGLLPHLTVRQTLDYATARAPSGAFMRKDVISKTGITALLDQRPSQLSGGEAQRVNIARTLLSQPRLLLLDEPLSALDIDARAVLQTNLQNMLKHAKCHVIYVTHDHAEAQAIADHTIWIANGKLSAPAVSA